MNITNILLGLILIIFCVFAKFVWPSIRTHMTTEQLNILIGIARTGVFAAEQMFGAKMGKDKLAYAIEYVKNLLATKNLTFDENIIRGAIEAQVKELNLEIKPEEKP